MATNETIASPSMDVELNLSKISETGTTKKRERRPNYTPEEKTYLAELVSQYQHIIEDKRTGGIFIKKKREAWRVITVKYNSNCTTGHRETEHLKTLYDNMKQQARKNDGECFTNVTTKLRLFQKHEFPPNKTSENGAEEDAIKTLQTMREEKLQMNDTSVDIYKSRRLEPDQVEGQVEPLANPYDSAAVYFRDNITHASEPAIDPIQFLDVSLPDGQKTEMKRDPCNHTPEHTWPPPAPSTRSPPPASGATSVEPMQRKKPVSAEVLKRLYFRKKCQNANLERKRILQEISHAQEKHNLEMILLRRAFDNKS